MLSLLQTLAFYGKKYLNLKYCGIGKAFHHDNIF